MFDVGFWELSLIFVVALIVLGPERLPRAARTAGLWMGKARQMLASVKADIDRELKAEELKAMMEKRAAMPELDELTEEINTPIRFDGDETPDTKADAKADQAPAQDPEVPAKSKPSSESTE